MWNTILACNSFIVMPLIFMLLIYSAGEAVFYWHWKLFFIAIFLFIIGLIMQVVLATLSE